jgi:hypothetical protein
MESFSLHEYFFTENHKIIENNEFKKDSRYYQIIEKVKRFIPLDDDSKFTVTAAAEHTWFFESDPSVKVKTNPNGSIMVATPEEQSETPQKECPFLDIKPMPFKTTRFFILMPK